MRNPLRSCLVNALLESSGPPPPEKTFFPTVIVICPRIRFSLHCEGLRFSLLEILWLSGVFCPLCAFASFYNPPPSTLLFSEQSPPTPPSGAPRPRSSVFFTQQMFPILEQNLTHLSLFALFTARVLDSLRSPTPLSISSLTRSPPKH